MAATKMFMVVCIGLAMGENVERPSYGVIFKSMGQMMNNPGYWNLYVHMTFNWTDVLMPEIRQQNNQMGPCDFGHSYVNKSSHLLGRSGSRICTELLPSFEAYILQRNHLISNIDEKQSHILISELICCGVNYFTT